MLEVTALPTEPQPILLIVILMNCLPIILILVKFEIAPLLHQIHDFKLAGYSMTTVPT